ncbi:MAG TPA: recombinase family protein [Lachnospiraceae bacterium]|nr:recombinase family protein [Lachnospiraceae bacterium]
MPNSKLCACYVRVSTENQIENYSIDEQIDRLTAYCRAKGITNHQFYTDGGYSGGNLNRPAMQNMLDDINKGLLDLVIVYKLDRLSRSQKDTLMLIEDRFLANSVDFVSVSENFDTTTPFGRAMIGILSVFAQLEKDQITERFTMGRIGRAKKGLFHGGSYIPTGYNYVNGRLIVNEYEALQVQEIFDRFNRGESINSIWKHMHTKYSTKYSNWNSESLVRSILSNTIYIGKIKFKGQEYMGQHTPIISNETFETAANLLASPERILNMTSSQKFPFKANNLLTSLLYCKKCGARYSGDHGYYTCYSRSKNDRRQIKDPNCKNRKWRIAELNNLVFERIESMKFMEIESLQGMNSKSVISEEITLNEDNISKRILTIKKQISNLIDLYQVGNLPLEEIQARIDSLTKEKDCLNRSFSRITEPQNISNNVDITFKDKFFDICNSGSLNEQRLLLCMLIDYIIIDDDVIEIHMKI